MKRSSTSYDEVAWSGRADWSGQVRLVADNSVHFVHNDSTVRPQDISRMGNELLPEVAE